MEHFGDEYRLYYCVKLAMRYTLPALYALFQIYFVRALYRAGNCVCGTIARAKRTAAAYFATRTRVRNSREGVL